MERFGTVDRGWCGYAVGGSLRVLQRCRFGNVCLDGDAVGRSNPEQ